MPKRAKKSKADTKPDLRETIAKAREEFEALPDSVKEQARINRELRIAADREEYGCCTSYRGGGWHSDDCAKLITTKEQLKKDWASKGIADVKFAPVDDKARCDSPRVPRWYGSPVYNLAINHAATIDESILEEDDPEEIFASGADWGTRWLRAMIELGMAISSRSKSKSAAEEAAQDWLNRFQPYPPMMEWVKSLAELLRQFPVEIPIPEPDLDRLRAATYIKTIDACINACRQAAREANSRGEFGTVSRCIELLEALKTDK